MSHIHLSTDIVHLNTYIGSDTFVLASLCQNVCYYRYTLRDCTREDSVKVKYLVLCIKGHI